MNPLGFQPSLNEDTNMKIHKLRKNMMNDVLQYNLQSYYQRKGHEKNMQSIAVDNENKIIEQEQQVLRKEKQQNRLNHIMRRQMLRQQYERQIKEKQEKKRKEREYDQIYAKIEKDYQQYSNQRRIYDIERMFNRRSYRASLNESSPHNRPYSLNQQQFNQRLKTEPPSLNPEYIGGSQNHLYPQKMNNLNNMTPQNHRYQDSLDHIQVPNASNNNAPPQYSNRKVTFKAMDNSP